MGDIDITKKTDWSNPAIVFEVHKEGSSLRKLSVANGLSPETLKTALMKRYPKAERIIADFLGVHPSVIWPSRYPETKKGADK